MVHIRNCLYLGGFIKARNFPGKTISVGNIEVGGTGKTPVVIEIASYLRKKGFSPIIVTRGYKSGLKSSEFVVIENGKYVLGDCDYETVTPDEAMLQSVKLRDVPVVVGARRFDATMCFLIATKFKATHFILDDGFQHRQIARDFDLVLIRESINVTRSGLLPLGRQREPVSNLSRANALLYMRTKLSKDEILEEVDCITKPLPNIFIAGIKNSRLVEFNSLASDIMTSDSKMRAAAACAIAHPQEFLKALNNIGIIVPHENFAIAPDHEKLSSKLNNSFLERCDYLVITEKDLYREEHFYRNLSIPVFFLELNIELPVELLESL